MYIFRNGFIAVQIVGNSCSFRTIVKYTFSFCKWQKERFFGVGKYRV